MHQTYAETATLVAVMEDDRDEARRLIKDFLDGELSDFADQVETLGNMIEAEQRRREVAR
jgi:hypothetical protein